MDGDGVEEEAEGGRRYNGAGAGAAGGVRRSLQSQ